MLAFLLFLYLTHNKLTTKKSLLCYLFFFLEIRLITLPRIHNLNKKEIWMVFITVVFLKMPMEQAESLKKVKIALSQQVNDFEGPSGRKKWGKDKVTH